MRLPQQLFSSPKFLKQNESKWTDQYQPINLSNHLLVKSNHNHNEFCPTSLLSSIPCTTEKHQQTQLHLRFLNETPIPSSFIPTLLSLVPLVCGYLKPSLPLLVVGLDKKNIISFISAIIQLPPAWLPCNGVKHERETTHPTDLSPENTFCNEAIMPMATVLFTHLLAQVANQEIVAAVQKYLSSKLSIQRKDHLLLLWTIVPFEKLENTIRLPIQVVHAALLDQASAAQYQLRAANQHLPAI
ncbi:hypothetical protein PCANC_16411 [Puccinia coronata f. sp. avenae]|uniref:Uncharacterized protein n=1 Tax=Puccinia coronata f. sp. avenae TaxID=200324 RepID=A0A2N5SYL2_9BASI|nr:hypothetical protein PCANC_16411 [Puccinia coronata f. sp. avenae]